MSWQEEVTDYEGAVIDYYRLLTKSDLEKSDLDIERIQEILQQAENDRILSLLLNEVDNLVLQESSSNNNDDSYYANYQNWVEVFRTHVEFCTQFDTEVSRLMTTISSLLESLQEFKTSEAFESTLESPQSIDAKVESLELLMKEAKVEKDRRKIKRWLG